MAPQQLAALNAAEEGLRVLRASLADAPPAPDKSPTPPPGDMVLTDKGWLPRAAVFTGFRTVETAREVARHVDHYDRLTGEYLGGEAQVTMKKVPA